MDSQSSPSKTQLISNLFDAEDKLGERLKAFGCRFIKSPARIRTRLESMSEVELSVIHENLNNYSDILKLASESGVDPWDDGALLVLSMRKMGLTFPNDFLDILRPNEVLEAYDMNRRQTFRNIHFMEISNYALLEVLSYDWPMLFHRDTEITNIIARQVEQDMWATNYVIPTEVPVHQIRELLCEEPQICEVQMLYFAPLFVGPNKPGGALVVSAARAIGPDKLVDRENLSFIR